MKKYLLLLIVWFSAGLHGVNVFAANDYENLSQINNSQHKLTSVISNTVSRKYVLGANDVLSIYVYDSPEFNQENVRVHPDGKIVIEPLGTIQVAGITIDELHDLLVEKYKYYLNDPRVSIKLDQTKPFIVYVTGAVLNPGSYEIDTDTAKTPSNINANPETQIERKAPLLSNVLVAAGGILYDADLEHIKITNQADKNEIKVNLLNLLENGNSTEDIYLMAGDSIYVPKLPTPLAVNEQKYRKFAGATFSQRSVPVKVFGYVNSPGLVKLDSSQSLNINSAITAAGGYLTDSAYPPKKVYLSRVDTSGKLVTTVVNPMGNDVMLMPNDIVYVPEKVRPLVGKAFDYLTRVINPIDGYANAYNNWALMFSPKRYQVIGK